MGAAYDTAVLADSPAGYWKLNERENLILWSEDFSNAAWTQPSGAVTVATTTDLAPDGVGHPQSVAFASGAILRQTGMTIAAGSCTVSIWARSTTGTGQITINLRGSGALSFNVSKDLQRYDLFFNNTAANANLDISGTTGVSFRLWGVLVTVGASPSGYAKTTSAMATATQFLDSSGNTRHMSRLSTGNGGTAFTMGITGPDYTDYALDFAGIATNPVINNATATWNRTIAQSVSVEFWIKPRFPGRFSEILWCNTISNNYNYGIRQDGVALGSITGYPSQFLTYRPPDAEWGHYVAVLTPTGSTIYKNGAVVWTDAFTSWIQSATPGLLNIGAINSTDTGSLFRGGLALVAVYLAALNQTQVQNHYNAMTNQDLGLARGGGITTSVAAADFARPTGQVSPGAAIPDVRAGDAGITVVSTGKKPRRVINDGFDGH